MTTKKRKKITKKELALLAMMLPGGIYMIINNYIPMAGIFIAFKNINFAKGIFGSPWNGLKNFKFLFSTGDAAMITRNTLLYNMVFIILNMVVGVTLAILLNEIVNKLLKKVFQTVLLMPQIISMVIVSYLAYAFLAGDAGFINNAILKPLGAAAVNWYSEKKYWPFILVFIHVWKTMGYSTLLYLASVVGIDASLFDAAAVDGASRLQQIRYITLPLLRPTMITMSLLMIGRIFYSDFGLFFQVPMNSGALYSVTQTIDTYVYRGLMSLGNIGMSAAAAFYQSIVGFCIVLISNGIVRKIDKDNALF